MFASYRSLFDAPGTTLFTFAGFLCRLPLAMTGIGIVTMLSHLKGSYSFAGLIAATFVLSYAVIAPQTSRLVDRFGQSKILPLAAIMGTLGLVMLVACTYMNAPNWLYFTSAVLSGFVPSISAMTRARWTAIFHGKPELQTAFSLEAVLDEISFIAGPPIAVALSVSWFPQAGIITAAIITFFGNIVFVLQRATEPVVTQHLANPVTKTAIREKGVAILVLLFVGMGTVVGTVDIVSVAFARQEGSPVAASYVLSAYAVGSALAGLAFGAVKLTAPLNRLLLMASAATAITTLLMLTSYNILLLSAAVFVAGLSFAPTMIVAMALIEKIVSQNRLTESMTWLLSGLSIGAAIGAAAAGKVVDSFGAQSGFLVAVAAGILIAITAIAAHQLLKPSTSEAPVCC